MRHARILPLGFTAVLVLVAGCGDDAETATGPSTTMLAGLGGATTAPAASTTAPVANGGWIGGEPDWFVPVEEMADGEYAAEGGSMTALDTMAAAAPDPMSGASSEPAAAEASRGGEDVSTGSLRAGSVDDNADFDGYLAYLERIRSLGIPLRAVDPTGRVLVSVVGTDGLPVQGASVEVSAGQGPVATLHTTADGTARFLPVLYGQAADGAFTFSVEGTLADATAGAEVALVVDRAGGATAPVPLDVLFLLDATGSMGDEIDRLTMSIDSVIARVDALAANPDARFAMTLYRDEGDAFVTATHDFTGDVEAFRGALADVVADGGGDYPEALDEGLAAALTEPTWRDASTTVQLVFLVGDAPPQIARQVEQPYPDSVVDAVGRGIKVFPVASSESDDQAEAVFRQIAQATGARFVFLTYGAGGAATGGNTDIQATDYEELALDDLVVRLIAEELAALTGDDTVVPPPTPTTTTIPQGQ